MKIVVDADVPIPPGYGNIIDMNADGVRTLDPLTPRALVEMFTQYESVKFVYDKIDNQTVIKMIPEIKDDV